jgi:hypothetical protein
MAITFHNFWQSPISLPRDVATTLVPYSASSSVSYSASSSLAQSNANRMLEASAGAKESLEKEEESWEKEEESLEMLGGQLEKCCTKLKDAHLLLVGLDVKPVRGMRVSLSTEGLSAFDEVEHIYICMNSTKTRFTTSARYEQYKNKYIYIYIQVVLNISRQGLGRITKVMHSDMVAY